MNTFLGESAEHDKAIIWWTNLTNKKKKEVLEMYDFSFIVGKNGEILTLDGDKEDLTNDSILWLYFQEHNGQKKCRKGWQGQCCCNCTSQLTITKHPWNKAKRFKGPVSELTGLFICKVFNDIDRNDKRATASERKHGICELHTYKGEV